MASPMIADLGYEPKTKLLSVDIIEPNEEVANKLGLKNKLREYFDFSGVPIQIYFRQK